MNKFLIDFLNEAKKKKILTPEEKEIIKKKREEKKARKEREEREEREKTATRIPILRKVGKLPNIPIVRTSPPKLFNDFKSKLKMLANNPKEMRNEEKLRLIMGLQYLYNLTNVGPQTTGYLAEPTIGELLAGKGKFVTGQDPRASKYKLDATELTDIKVPTSDNDLKVSLKFYGTKNDVALGSLWRAYKNITGIDIDKEEDKNRAKNIILKLYSNIYWIFGKYDVSQYYGGEKIRLPFEYGIYTFYFLTPEEMKQLLLPKINKKIKGQYYASSEEIEKIKGVEKITLNINEMMVRDEEFAKFSGMAKGITSTPEKIKDIGSDIMDALLKVEKGMSIKSVIENLKSAITKFILQTKEMAESIDYVITKLLEDKVLTQGQYNKLSNKLTSLLKLKESKFEEYYENILNEKFIFEAENFINKSVKAGKKLIGRVVDRLSGMASKVKKFFSSVMSKISKAESTIVHYKDKAEKGELTSKDGEEITNALEEAIDSVKEVFNGLGELKISESVEDINNLISEENENMENLLLEKRKYKKKNLSYWMRKKQRASQIAKKMARYEKKFSSRPVTWGWNPSRERGE